MKQSKISSFLTKLGRVRPTRKAETKKQQQEYDVEYKAKLREEYLPIWAEKLKQYYCEDVRCIILQALENKLDPKNPNNVHGLNEQLKTVFKIMQLARIGKVREAEKLYVDSGKTYLERRVKYIDYIANSYYAAELMNVMTRDIEKYHFNKSDKFIPEVAYIKKRAKELKKLGIMSIHEKQAKKIEELKQQAANT